MYSADSRHEKKGHNLGRTSVSLLAQRLSLVRGREEETSKMKKGKGPQT